AAYAAGPATEPGVSNSPGGRTITRPFGPTYDTGPRPRPDSDTRENSAGIQRCGSYTCSTPTMALIPEQTSRSQRIRARCSGDLTNAGAQKSGVITAKYTARCASPPTNDGVCEWKSITESRNITAKSQLCARDGRTLISLLMFHQTNAASGRRNADARIGRRIPCVPGRIRIAGRTVWLRMKSSANPHGTRAGAAPATDCGGPFMTFARAFTPSPPSCARRRVGRHRETRG